MAGKNLSFYNLTGGLNTQQGLFTINAGTNRTETPDMVNIEYYKLGGIKSMDGNIQIGKQFVTNGTPTKITSGFEYQYKNDRYLIVTTFTGGCYLYNEKTKEFEKFYNFPSNTERHSITKYMNGIVIVNGVDNLLYYEKERNQKYKGTVSLVANTITVTGTDTLFKSELTEGDVIAIGDETYRVDNIISDTEIEISRNTGDYNFNGVPLNTENNVEYYQTPISIVKAQLINTDEKNPIEPKDINGLAIASYKGRLWIGDNNGYLYYSELGLLKWDILYGAGGFTNFDEDTSSFTGLGIWDKYLIAHRKNGTYLVNGNADDSNNWTIEPYSEMTPESQQSFISNDIGYYLFDKNNQAIYPLLSRSLYNSTYLGKDLSVKINNSFNTLDYTKLDTIYVTYHPQKQYLVFYMNFLEGNGYSNYCYIYDMLTKTWLRRILPQQVTAAFRFDNNIYIGTQDGFVLKEFVGKSFNGEPIEFLWTSPYYGWGGGTNKTTTREFRIKLNKAEANNFKIESIRDGSIKDKKPRIINTNKSNGNNLIWDTGYNFTDMILKDVELDVFHYKGSNGTDYYSLENALTSNNIKMYLDVNLTEFAGYNNDLYTTIQGTKSNYDYITYTTQKIFKWIGLDLSQKCYRSTKDPNIKAWVKLDDTTKAIVNLREGENISLYGYSIQRFHVDGRWYIFDYRISKEVYDYLIKYQKEGKQVQLSADKNEIYRYYNGGWHKSQQNGSTVGYEALFTNNQARVGSNYYPFNFTGGLLFRLPSGQTFVNMIQDDGANELTRKPQNDVKTAYSEWNGNTTPEDGIEKTISTYGLEAIVIDGVTYTRYPEGDYGQNNSFPVYTTTSLQPGDKVYSDDKLTEETGIIKVYTREDTPASSITTEDDRKYYYKSPPLTKEIPNYWLKDRLDYTFIRMEKALTSYPYPEDEGRSLTDTTWDNNTWVEDGNKTIRFILPNQYFETIQYKFYGTTKDENISILGFEVDGIQLVEVPY